MKRPIIDLPDAQTLRRFFERPRAIVSIIGAGGSGKSTLACAIARWAIASEPEERLLPHKMLPVVVVEDTENLLRTAAQILRRMLNSNNILFVHANFGEVGRDLYKELILWMLCCSQLLCFSEPSEANFGF
jgi:hypothetical protein